MSSIKNMLPSRLIALTVFGAIFSVLIELELLHLWAKRPVSGILSIFSVPALLLLLLLLYTGARYRAIQRWDTILGRECAQTEDVDFALRDILVDPIAFGSVFMAAYLGAHLPLIATYLITSQPPLTIFATSLVALGGALASGGLAALASRHVRIALLSSLSKQQLTDPTRIRLWSLDAKLLFSLSILLVVLTVGWSLFSYYGMRNAAGTGLGNPRIIVFHISVASIFFFGVTFAGVVYSIRHNLLPLHILGSDAIASGRTSPSVATKYLFSSREVADIFQRISGNIEALRIAEEERALIQEKVDVIVAKRLEKLRQTDQSLETERSQWVSELEALSAANLRSQQLIQDQLARIRRLSDLQRYVPSEVTAAVMNDGKSTELARKKLTVFFSDIVGFTATTDSLEPEQLVQVLNQYFSEMTSVAIANGATLDKFIGDAILLFFAHDRFVDEREAAVRCVEMALQMQEKMKTLWATWEQSGITNPFRIRIGINTGFATVGDMGSELRMQYTAIGNQVNIASRIESAAAIGEVWISHATNVLVRHRFLTESRGDIDAKGIHYPIPVFAVIAPLNNVA